MHFPPSPARPRSRPASNPRWREQEKKWKIRHHWAGRRVNNWRLSWPSIESHHWKKSSREQLVSGPQPLNWTTKFESASRMQRCQRVAFAPPAGGDKHFSWARYIIALGLSAEHAVFVYSTYVCARSVSAMWIHAHNTLCCIASFNLVYLPRGIIFARAHPRLMPPGQHPLVAYSYRNRSNWKILSESWKKNIANVIQVNKSIFNFK